MAGVGEREPDDIGLGTKLRRLWVRLLLAGAVLAVIAAVPAVRNFSGQGWWWTMGLWAFGSVFYTLVEVEKWRQLRTPKPPGRRSGSRS